MASGFFTALTPARMRISDTSDSASDVRRRRKRRRRRRRLARRRRRWLRRNRTSNT